MKIGDSLRVTERKYRKKEAAKVTQGKIIAITPGGITILKANGTRETFNVADLMNKSQKKEVYEGQGRGWQEIEGRKEGKSLVLCKVNKTNNRCGNTNNNGTIKDKTKTSTKKV